MAELSDRYGLRLSFTAFHFFCCQTWGKQCVIWSKMPLFVLIFWFNILWLPAIMLFSDGPWSHSVRFYPCVASSQQVPPAARPSLPFTVCTNLAVSSWAPTFLCCPQCPCVACCGHCQVLWKGVPEAVVPVKWEWPAVAALVSPQSLYFFAVSALAPTQSFSSHLVMASLSLKASSEPASHRASGQGETSLN